MSDKERPKGDVIGGGPDDEGGEGPTSTGDPKDINCKGCKKKGKRVSLFRLRKAKKWLPQKRKQKGIYLNTVCCRRRAGGGGGWCCLCVKQPITVGSSGESPPSDPESPLFTFDMLSALIEKNDFYSKECNPHLDADD